MGSARKEVIDAQLRDDARALVDLLARTPREQRKVRSDAVVGLGSLVLKRRDMRPFDKRDKPREPTVTAAEALRVLAEIAGDGREHESVRWYAANALGDHGDERALPALAALLHEPSQHLRKQGAYALRELGHPAAERELLQALGDPDRDVRAEAARALGVVGGEDAVAPLAERARHDEKLFVRQEALAALKSIGGAEARRTIDEVLTAESGLTGWRLRRWLERESS